MNPALVIFTQIAIAGGGFLVYFLYALRRESRKMRRSPKVEIRPLSTKPSRVKVIQVYTTAEGNGTAKTLKDASSR